MPNTNADLAARLKELQATRERQYAEELAALAEVRGELASVARLAEQLTGGGGRPHLSVVEP